MVNLSRLSEAVETGYRERVFACVVYKNNPISFGYNQKKSHPFQKNFGRNADSIYLHAEIHAIVGALKVISVDELSRCSMYVLRQKHYPAHSKVMWGMAKPCEGCQRAIAQFGIKKVYYTHDFDSPEEGFGFL